MPRFPSYVGVQGDSALPTVLRASPPPAKKASPSGSKPESDTSTARRFELVEGSASKFWEVARDGVSVTVRFGRLGSAGPAKTKDFGSEELARRHADGLIEEKLSKGYRE